MNGILVENFNMNSDGRRIQPLRNVRRFVSNKRKFRNFVQEQKPLMTADDSCSDEEVTLHDIRDLQKVPNQEQNFFSLRHIKKVDKNRNDDISENKIYDPFHNCDFVYLKIEEGDTLQSISIKYQCSVSDLKRANNLLSSQEFFGLSQLKIPVKKFSVLTEVLDTAPERKSDSTFIDTDANIQTINIGIGTAGRCPSPQDSAAFFKRMDEDLVKIMLSTNTKKDSLEAAAVALTTPQIQPLVKDPYHTVIQWNYLLGFIIIIALVIPAAVSLYMYIRTSHGHEHHTYPSNSNQSFDTISKVGVKDKS